MAWNHPKEVQSAKQEVRSKKRVLGAGCLVLGAACLVIGLGAWLLRPEGERGEDAASTRRGTIRDAKRVARSPAHGPRTTNHEPQGTRPPAGHSPTGRVVVTKNVTPPMVLGSDFYAFTSGGRPVFRAPIFTHHSENLIAELLSSQPGERFLDIALDDFDEDFALSLKKPIVVRENDTEDDALVKEAVIKAKEAIAERMKGGAKPSEIVASMREEMNKVADYRDMLEEKFSEVKDTQSMRDVLVYFKEANQLLDEFGALHLELPEEDVADIKRRLAENPVADSEGDSVLEQHLSSETENGEQK